MNDQFETPQDVEDTFYDAFEAHDLDGMMGVWADSDEVTCILPMGPLLQGIQAVRDSWGKLFQHDTKPEVTIRHVQWLENDDLAVHVVEEKISVPDMPQPMPSILATNVYRRLPVGWRMVMHQTSPPVPRGPLGM